MHSVLKKRLRTSSMSVSDCSPASRSIVCMLSMSRFDIAVMNDALSAQAGASQGCRIRLLAPISALRTLRTRFEVERVRSRYLVGEAGAHLSDDRFPVGLNLGKVAFWEVWHAHDFDEDDTVVERVCIGDPQIGNQQDIFGLLHEATRLERFVDDLHVIDHADDEPFLRSQPTVLVSFERGGFNSSPASLKSGAESLLLSNLK